VQRWRPHPFEPGVTPPPVGHIDLRWATPGSLQRAKAAGRGKADAGALSYRGRLP
jgi:hypothetical protein